jgi:outer membrane biosynthesis protein TonB
MVSLSTVYGVSIFLGSLAAMGAAVVGTKVYPIQSGGDPLLPGIGIGATITGFFASAADKIKGTFSSEPTPPPAPEVPAPPPPPVQTSPPPPPPPTVQTPEKEEEKLPGSSV